MEDNNLLNFSIINIDKPTGPTSFSITEYVRRGLKLSKASHMGTLDPKVTGVLPITLGRACRLAQFIIAHDKTYVGILHTHKEQKLEDLQKLIDENFVGEIIQTPPHKSAVKRAPRKRRVFYFNLLEADDAGRDFLFETKVEGGTYIRKLCSDLGEMIEGAHMDELRRTQAGDFAEDSLITLSEFDRVKDNLEELKKYLIPADVVIRKILPVVNLKKSNKKSLLSGKPLLNMDVGEAGVDLKDGDFFVLDLKGEFIGIYRRIKGDGVFAKPEFVYN